MIKILILLALTLIYCSCTNHNSKSEEKDYLTKGTYIFPSQQYPAHRFKNYHINNQIKTPIKFLLKKSRIKKHRFRTRIRYAINQGINFAGYAILAQWGCGSSCQSGVIINVQTGDILPLPTASFGYLFKKDSMLLIVNPFLKEEYTKGRHNIYKPPHYYIYKNGRLHALK